MFRFSARAKQTEILRRQQRCGTLCRQSGMSRDKIETAIREGIPFVIKLADGEKYEVTDRLRIALGQTSVIIIVGNDDMPHILPLLTVTGISYLKPSG
jgi:hypothetical protein